MIREYENTFKIKYIDDVTQEKADDYAKIVLDSFTYRMTTEALSDFFEVSKKDYNKILHKKYIIKCISTTIDKKNKFININLKLEILK